MTSPDPLPPEVPLRVRIVTTDGRVRSATLIARQVASCESDVVSATSTPPITAPAAAATASTAAGLDEYRRQPLTLCSWSCATAWTLPSRRAARQ